jgi:hypothetical protein
MIEDEVNFLEVKALGEDLAWRVIKLWMQSAGRDLNNYQVTSPRDGIEPLGTALSGSQLSLKSGHLSTAARKFLTTYSFITKINPFGEKLHFWGL